MEKIFLYTIIQAPIEICFDLSRSIDFHKSSLKDTGEKAICGITSGLIGMDQTVTWEARHLGFTQRLTSRITKYDFPLYFKDEMTKGIFKSLRHDHYFKSCGRFTIMKDVFEFEAPFGIIGKLFEQIILKRYLSKLLKNRNTHIKEVAENGEWKKYLTFNTF